MKTSVYRIPRTVLARYAALEYLSNFWWVAIIVPLFGIACLIFTKGLIQAIGLFAVLWPFSIPARAIVATNKSARFFGSGVTAFVEDGVIYFGSEAGGGMKLALSRIRDARRIGDYLRIRMGLGQFVLIPVNAIPNEDLAQFGVPLTAR